MLNPNHLQELKDSAIHPDLIEGNFQSLEGQAAVDALCGNRQWKRRNDGRLTDSELRKYYAFADGGWYCSAGEGSQWGCFKPDKARIYWDKEKQREKTIKYEHPAGMPTEVFKLRVTRHIWRMVARKNGLDCPDLTAIANEDISKAFWQWVEDNPNLTIIITEGAKKTASLLSHGYVAIGLPGIYSGYRSKDAEGNPLIEKQLIPQLSQFCQPDRPIVFCFDNDSKASTVANVRTAIANTGYLFQAKGCQVSVMVWKLSLKGIDDVIATYGAATLDRIFVTRLSLEAYQLREHTDLTPLISQMVNCRYLGEELSIPAGAKLVSLKSAKGTNKTGKIAEIIRNSGDRRVIVISHREQLCKELANRFGLEYRTELSQVGRNLGYVLCVDSLHPKATPPFNPDNWEGCLVVIDECEQVLWHLLNSSTCIKNRPAILETLTKLVNGADQVILSDADLTRVSIDYVKGLLTDSVVPYVVVNEFVPAANRRAHLSLTPEALFSDALECIRNGDRLMIHTGGQKVGSRWGSINLEKNLRAFFPDHKILRIDAETVATTDHPAFGVMGNLNAIVPLYDIVIASPTLETGVSIDVPHFDRVFCFATGSQTVEAVCQSVARVRQDVPRHIFVKKTSNQRIGNGSTIPKLLVKSQQKIFTANMNLLGQAEAIAVLDGQQPRHLATWATFAAIHNAGFKNYLPSIVSRLESEGYTISDSDTPDDSGEIKELIKAYSDAHAENHREKIAAADILDDADYDRVSNARAKTEQERLSEAKTAIAKKYLTDDITPDLIEADEKGLYGQLQLRYYLTLGRQFVEDRDRKRVAKLTEQTGQAFTPDVNAACYFSKIRTLEFLNIRQFFTGQEFTSDSLAEWFTQLQRYSRDIKIFLNQTIGKKDTAIGFAQRLLGLTGLKMTCTRRRVNGKIIRLYSLPVTPPDDMAQTIMGRWFDRDINCDTPSININNQEVA